MRFGYVLLGLVTLMSVHLSIGQECRNGFVGFERGDVCCAESCGTCGGRRCGALDGGRDNCCEGAITSNGMLCSETMAAPCIIDEVEMCNNGLPGIQTGDFCCDLGCGRCGGRGCRDLPGGAVNCCETTATRIDMLCSVTGEAPCVVDDAVLCSNGVPGRERDGVCCEIQCGTCGGSGCHLRPGGRESCCTSRIEESQIFCDDTLTAPCIIGGDEIDDDDFDDDCI